MTVYHASTTDKAAKAYMVDAMGEIMTLAGQYRRKWPARDEAIKAALGFIRRGRFERLPADASGADRWHVDGHLVSRSKNECTCGSLDVDPDPRFGLLCAHRIAAVLLYNVYPRIGFSPLSGLAQEAAAAARQRQANGDRPAAVDLLITGRKEYNAPEGLIIVTGYRLAGQPETRLDAADQFWIAPITVSMELAPHLAMVRAPAKSSRTASMEYDYAFSVAGLIPADGYTFTRHDSGYYEEIEAREARRREAEIGDMNAAAAAIADQLIDLAHVDREIAGAEAAAMVATAKKHKRIGPGPDEIAAAAVRLIARQASKMATTRK